MTAGKILMNIESYLFTASNPVSLAQRQDPCEHRSLPLENECHLLPFHHNWIHWADHAQPSENKLCHIE